MTTSHVSFDQLPTLIGTKTTGEPFTVTAEDQDKWDRACWIDRAYPAEDPDFPDNIIEGFYSLSLLDALARFAGLSDDETSWGLNYGLDRVRFVSQMYFGDRIIPQFEIIDVKPKGEGYLILRRCTLIVEGAARPGVIADWWIFALPRGAKSGSTGGQAT